MLAQFEQRAPLAARDTCVRARHLDVRHLILTHRYDVGVVEQNIGRHEHRVGKEPGICLQPFCHFVFVGVRLLQKRYRNETIEDPGKFCMLRNI